jgi:hypothetical protein
VSEDDYNLNGRYYERVESELNAIHPFRDEGFVFSGRLEDQKVLATIEGRYPYMWRIWNDRKKIERACPVRK